MVVTAEGREEGWGFFSAPPHVSPDGKSCTKALGLGCE